MRKSDWIAGLFLVVSLLLVLVGAFFALRKSDLFVDYTDVQITAHSGSKLSSGMPVTYAGFPIGQVRELELTGNGLVRVELAIRTAEMRWLRENSTFVQVVPFVGGGEIEVVTPNLEASAFTQTRIRFLEQPELVEDLFDQVRPILANLEQITSRLGSTEEDGSVPRILADVEKIVRRFANEPAWLTIATGDEDSGRKLDGLLGELKGTAEDARGRMFGEDSIAVAARDSLRALESQLVAFRPVLENMETVTGNLGEATEGVEVIKLQLETTLSSLREIIYRVENLLGGNGGDYESP